jgi:3'-phosphoadenosine 5'-phosphosulfate sulfotransferase (PAPS reductase)/FAD synthetase
MAVKTVYFRDRVEENPEEPKLTVLNFSAGTQSSVLLWMVLRGEIQIPENFIVLQADPGMENSDTYRYSEMMRGLCKTAQVPYFVAPGPSLYQDLVELSNTDKSRLDNPPYWTKNEKGKVGRLKHKCTYTYKIAPMDRFIRRYLEEQFGISSKSKRMGEGIVEKWIGFGYDEVLRIKPPNRKYVRFCFPLIDLGWDRDKVNEYYTENNLPKPPRSVCNACFANGVSFLKEMYQSRPKDWRQAVEVDKAVRDWSQIGINDTVFVSPTAKPLEQLAEEGFPGSEDNHDDDSCTSGYCFI